ncbi:MAG: DNA polymerase IV [Rhizobiales bacterium NRL2]|jgi:DNA polymerase-4|nr:MAG: DNA polymerase IV [Rhizobiales bacterium NRL2]
MALAGIVNALCRDCFSTDIAGDLCAACGSPRTLGHAELLDLSIAHIDCDAFYASVEKRDDPSLRDKPLIIGGGRRGVVSTACYLARIYGVRSAMPMFKALKVCPDAVVRKPDMKKYAAVSRQIRALMLDLTPLVEPLSIDEAFLDLTGTARVHHASPAATLARLAQRIETEIGVTISVGLSYNKFLAKLASDLDKPRGFAVIGRAEAVEFLAPRPVSDIYGVGRAFAGRLAADGIRTFADLRRHDETELMRRYGVIGKRLRAFADGRDTRAVNPDGERKSVSTETTFNDDIAGFDELARILWRLSEDVSATLKEKRIAGRTVTLKLRTADFRIHTRSHTLDHLTQLAGTIYHAAEPLLRREADGRRRFRLIGVGMSGLDGERDADPPDLLDQDRAKRRQIEGALDRIRARYGKTSIGEGRGFGSNSRKQRDQDR